jgi:hypothetical protein
MARIRTVKPELFRHEGLQDLERDHPGMYPMLVFIGLFGHCDKGGVFEWKPRVLKLDILPFLDFDMAKTLRLLEEAGQLQQFEVEGKIYGLIPSFTEHQTIGGKESQAPVKFPRPNGEKPENKRGSSGEATETAGREGKGREQVDLLGDEERGRTKTKKARPSPKTTIPDDFVLDEDLTHYVTEKIPDASATKLFESFCGKARSKGWLYSNWRQAFQEFVRNCAPNSGHWAAGQYPKANSAESGRWM